MKKKKYFYILSVIMYTAALFLIVGYCILEINETVLFTPSNRLILLGGCCFFMYIGGRLLSENLDRPYKKRPYQVNIIIWFLLYLVLLCTLTLFDNYFGRSGLPFLNWNSSSFCEYINNYFNIIPFKTVGSFVNGYIRGYTDSYTFAYNIFGNIAAFMPFAFFLPLIFKKQQSFPIFVTTMVGIVAFIEILQFVTFSGSCDIDDLILNVAGAALMYGILHTKFLYAVIRKVFLPES